VNLREDDVSAAVQHAFSDVHLNTPVEQVLGRGRRLRTRRRTAAGGLTVATAAIALAVPLLQPAADGPGPMVRARVAPAASAGKAGVQLDLAAYSVHTGADGNGHRAAGVRSGRFHQGPQ
jgi:hypothetical protein